MSVIFTDPHKPRARDPTMLRTDISEYDRLLPRRTHVLEVPTQWYKQIQQKFIQTTIQVSTATSQH